MQPPASCPRERTNGNEFKSNWRGHGSDYAKSPIGTRAEHSASARTVDFRFVGIRVASRGPGARRAYREGKTLGMKQPYDRVYNFSAGPCTLPVPVLEEARDGMLNWCGSGMSVMEMSHRSSTFQKILDTTVNDLRTLLEVPADYTILFLQGGASMQFSMVPMTFLGEGQSADYVVTGTWGKKALEAAQIAGNVNVAYDGKDVKYNDAPDFGTLPLNPKAAYLHYTSNETIQGVDFQRDFDLPMPVVCDMSSNILSRPIDVTKYAMIYAGAQKNMGPAGATAVVIHQSMLDRVPKGLQPSLDYTVHAENGSMYNTPPCWSIFMCGLVYKHMLKTGGVAAAQKRNEEKAAVLYSAIDGSGGFYRGHAKPHCRSKMNVTFNLPSEELTNAFVAEAEAQGFDGLKGHRAVGGIRASIYNAFPREGCDAFAEFMGQFAKTHG